MYKAYIINNGARMQIHDADPSSGLKCLGKGKEAILKAIEDTKYDIVNEAQKLGMNVDLGIAGGVFNGVGYVEKSTSYLG